MCTVYKVLACTNLPLSSTLPLFAPQVLCIVHGVNNIKTYPIKIKLGIQNSIRVILNQVVVVHPTFAADFISMILAAAAVLIVGKTVLDILEQGREDLDLFCQ